jgi:phospholipid/cholesterol/gamma-HCH transport system permease protein
MELASHSVPRRRLFDPFADFGQAVTRWMVGLGDVTLFSLQALACLLRRPPRRETLIPSCYQIGVLSLPVVALTGVFIGMVLAVHSYTQFKAVGLETRLGAVINKALVRELGPVLAATMLAGRVGSAMAAELGTMRVTEQIDALQTMGVHPIRFLVVPRFLACLVLIPCLTIMADFMGVLGGYFFSTVLLGVDSHHYWHHSRNVVSNLDLFTGLFKSLFYGAAIGLVSCHQGFRSEGGAEGVGRAATRAFVYSFVTILILDLLLGIMLNAVTQALRTKTPSFI